MQNETRLKFNKYMDAIAQLSGVADATKSYSVAPTVQQRLETKIQLSSDFLKKINIVGVDEMKGEKLALGVSSTIAGTTDTSTKDRVPVDPTDLDSKGYECAQINFDTALKYGKLDMWAKFPDFQTRIRDAITQQQGRDRIMIGWNGIQRVATSNRATNPLLQDVAKGWLQKIREEAPDRVLKKGDNADQVRVGTKAGYDYVSIDAAVLDARNNLIDEVFADDTGLVAIVGRDLMNDKYFPIVNKVQDNSEVLAADVIMSQKRIGGLPAIQVPFFPAGKVLITRLDNLSIYYQNGKRRRNTVDNSRRDQVEDFQSSNEDFVVEDYRICCLIENIVTEW